MNIKHQQPVRKLGANRGEFALKSRKHDANFAQSRDIREDRGERQIKLTKAGKTLGYFKRGH